jgi:hypothetical protein
MGKSIEEMLDGVEAWESVVNENGFVDDENRIRITEAFMSADAPILFPKVINRVLREAAEPAQLIVPLLQTVRLAQGRSLEFPAVNAIRAFEIPEGQEYPEQALAFAKQVEGKVSKKGVKLAFTDEVVADSQWDIVGLHVRAAGRAMARLKEQIALGRFRDAASIVFDNDDSDYDDTTGIGSTGAANSTITFEDVIDMAAVLLAEGHQPTDFILHPLMWAVFLKGSNNFVNGTGITQEARGAGITAPTQVINATTPLGLNALVSPYVGWTPRDEATPAKSDIFLIDRNEIGALLVKEDLSVDEWTDQTRDIRNLKLKERYDIVAFGDGEGITVAKNVDLARNYEIQLTNEVA